MLKENRKYYHHDGFLFNKKLLSFIIAWGVISIIGCIIWSMLSTSHEFNHGIMPQINSRLGFQDRKIDLLEDCIRKLAKDNNLNYKEENGTTPFTR